MKRTDTRRGGFTLLELMVVVLLIITLAALSAGAFYKIQASQRVGATEATMRKIQIKMDDRYRAVLDDARKTVPDAVVTLAGDDKGRALSIWTYAKLKNEFPQSFDEVWTTTPTPGPLPINVNGAVLMPRTIFTTIASKTYTPTPTPQEQAAALLYVALTSTGTGGTSGDLDGLNQQVGTTPSGLTVFVDNWGTPITFVRWADPDEVQSEPFIRKNVIQTRSGTSYSLNPLDTAGKLLGPPPAPPARRDNPLGTPRFDNPWGTDMVGQNFVNRFNALNALFPGQGLQYFPNRNFVPTLISAGPDKIFGTDPYGADSTDAGSDNILSYRLRREGAQGN